MTVLLPLLPGYYNVPLTIIIPVMTITGTDIVILMDIISHDSL